MVNKDNLQAGPKGLVFLEEMVRMIDLDKTAKAIKSGNLKIATKDIFFSKVKSFPLHL